jgi:hypothetical protein
MNDARIGATGDDEGNGGDEDVDYEIKDDLMDLEEEVKLPGMDTDTMDEGVGQGEEQDKCYDEEVEGIMGRAQDIIDDRLPSPVAAMLNVHHASAERKWMVISFDTFLWTWKHRKILLAVDQSQDPAMTLPTLEDQIKSHGYHR